MTSDSNLYKIIGELVRYTRKRAGLTQDELANRAGLTRTSITNLEAGNQQIRVHTLLNLAKALGVSPQELLPRVDETNLDSVDEHLQDKNLAEPEREWVKRIIG